MVYAVDRCRLFLEFIEAAKVAFHNTPPKDDTSMRTKQTGMDSESTQGRFSGCGLPFLYVKSSSLAVILRTSFLALDKFNRSWHHLVMKHRQKEVMMSDKSETAA